MAEKKTAFQAEVEKVLRALRKEIYSGLRLPRERLVESDLALSFSVSRMVIRQALATLKTEGLVEIAPYKGASVAPISIKSIRENYQILSVLEGFATGLAAAGLRPEDLDNLKSIVKQQRALDPGDVKEWQRLNQDFHRTIEKACGNRRLGELIRRYAYFTTYWFLALSAPGRIAVNVKEHEAVVKALEKKDAEKARALVERHIMGAGEHLMEHLKLTMPMGILQ